MKTTDVETLLQVAAQAERMRPAIKHLKEVLLAYGEDAADIIEPIVDYATDSAARTYKRLRNEHGFGHEDAMALTETLIGTVKQQFNSRNTKKD
jgi:ferritin-like protein